MPEPHVFDMATTLIPISEGHYQGQTSPDYANMAGPFGGVTAANLMQSVLLDPRLQGDPVSITVNFCAAVKTGGYTVTNVLKRDGKYIQHWSVELVQQGILAATASVITAQRKAEFSRDQVQKPTVRTLEDSDLPTMRAPLKWLERYDFRFVEGMPDFTGQTGSESQSAKTTQYVADLPPRPLDYLSLTSLSDAFVLRLLLVRPKLVPAGTVSLTTHFIGSRADIAEQGDAHLLGVADATRFHGNFHDQHMQLWSTNGKLLATGTQIVWFKS